MNTKHVKKITLASDVETKVNSSANNNSTDKLDKHMADYPIDGSYDPSTYKPHIQSSERTAYNAVVDEAVRTTNVTQSIAGDKTFTGTVTVPTPTADYQAATKKYVDDGLEKTWTVVNPSDFSTMLSTLFTQSGSLYTANYDVLFDVMFEYSANNRTYGKLLVQKGTTAPISLSFIGTFSLTSVTYAVMNIPFTSIFSSGEMAAIVYRKNTSGSGHMRITIHNTNNTTTSSATDTTIGQDLLTYIPSSTPYTGSTTRALYICVSYR